jgi:adenosylmethionine-8-amino-7-oxononanoate aminotransferase
VPSQSTPNGHLLLNFADNGAYASGARELLVIDRGEGVYVWDTQGRRYLDGLSSLFAAQLGYSYGAELGAAAAAQLERLGYWATWSATHEPALELAERVTALAPAGLDHVFFTNGGSESVETAWKLAIQYHTANGQPERRKAIARDTAYHGATIGALSLTGLMPMKEPFGPPAIPVRRVSNTNRFRSPYAGDDAALAAALIAELEEAIEQEGPETIAVIIAEPVQNAGGCLVPPDGYWRGLREVADRHGILLIADEVITGFGRLGEMYGSARVGAEPDLLTAAKGITAGMAPMGAVLVGERVASCLLEPGRTLLHGITFGGHPISCAIALKSLEIFEREGVLEHVRAEEAHVERRMRDLLELPIVGDVRGAGFLWAAEMVRAKPDTPLSTEDRARVVQLVPDHLRSSGIIARADDRGQPVVQIAPPLVASRAELDELLDGLHAALEAASHAYA